MVELRISFTCRATLMFHILKYIFLLITLRNENSSVHAYASKVKILRSIDGRVDRIRIPRLLCETTSADDIGCDVMQKRKAQSCSCTCNVTNPAGTSYVKSTVVYDNSSWQCLGNSQVRQLAGCNFLSIGEVITDPIPDITRKPSYVFNTPGQRCRINVLESAYMKCKGTWKRLSERVLRRFVNTSRTFTEEQVVIKYTGATNLSHPTVNGKIIRLVVSCRKQRKVNQNVGCIVMKMKGKMRCPLIASPKPTDGNKVKPVTTAPRNTVMNTTPKTPPLRPLQRPKIGASKKNIKKRGADAIDDATVIQSLAVVMGAFAVVILVIAIISALLAMVTRKLNSLGDQCATNQAG